MKKHIVILFVCFAAIGCITRSDSESTNESTAKTKAEILNYTVVKRENISFANNYRIVNRVVLNIDSFPIQRLMRETAREIVMDNYKTFLREQAGDGNNMEFKEATVFFYLPEMDTQSFAYAVAEFKSTRLDSFKVNEIALIGTKWEGKPDEDPQRVIGLTEYSIDIQVELLMTRRIKVTVETNFPDGTNMLLTVRRLYTCVGTSDAYSGNLFENKFVVTQGKLTTMITINDTEWYNEHQRLVKALPDDIRPIDTISDNINISVLYTPAGNKTTQITGILGENGEHVGGAGAAKSGRMTIFRVSKEFIIPFLV